VAEFTQASGTERLPPGRHVAISLGNALVFSVPGGLQAAARAREELRELLGPKLDPDVVEVAQLLMSELVNNCVLHGVSGRPDAWIEVAASTHPHCLWVEVSDGGPAFMHVPSAPSPEAVAGRGLYLVEELSSRWGISGQDSASVWFELARN
jgi:anti-sigma regulatory factor (Ser/Thr protein kinase)